jgi:two-component system, NtrC family, nitrogen regulation response regulator GlnG
MACPIALLAEDDAELRDLIGSALTRAGFLVRQARDGLELLANTALPETLPDLIITDVDMPRCNGLSALGAVHRFAPQIPAIVMTSFPDEATCAEARRFGAEVVLDKPFNVSSLCSLAREIVGSRDTLPAISMGR